MPNVLSVYRDGALYCQADLTGTGLRIGRGAENEVILEDSLKRVSRVHAELRVDGDRVTLTDLGSANGTLVDGGAVGSMDLAEGMPFDIGPYRLAWHVLGKAVTPGAEPSGSASIFSQSTAVYQHPPAAAPAGNHPSDTTKSSAAFDHVMLVLRSHPAVIVLSLAALVGGAVLAAWLGLAY